MKKRKGSSLFFVLLFGEAHLGISTFSKAETRNAVRPAGHFAICVRSLNCVAFSFLIEDRTDMLCMSISAPFGIHGKAIREAVCNQLAELRRKAHFEFSVNAHYIFSGESCDFCEAEITAFKTALFISFRFQLYSSHHRTLSSTAHANRLKSLGECHCECRF